MTPKEVLAERLVEWDTDYEASTCSDALIAALAAAGYVIVKEQEYDDLKSDSMCWQEHYCECPNCS